jgi:hypothetical protein
VYAS